MTGVDLLAVGGVAAGKDSFAKGVREGWKSKSLRLTNFTPTTFNPNAEAAISALVLALSIACFIRLFLISSNFLLDNVKSTLFTVLAPAAIAVSIHFDTFLMFVLCSVLN